MPDGRGMELAAGGGAIPGMKCPNARCSRGFDPDGAKRFTTQRIAGLYSRHLGQVATVLKPELEARF